jgi:deoxyribodipyrimidine photo-lyase
MAAPIAAFWLRRDLRLNDNQGLFKALQSGLPVLPVFIFDTEILEVLPDRADRRVSMLHDVISQLKAQLEARGSSLIVAHGNPLDVWPLLTKTYNIKKIFLNRDYEPYARQRDQAVFDWAKKMDIEMVGAKDSVIFEKSEVTKDDGKPYTVFTPYSKKWMARLTSEDLAPAPSENHLQHLYPTAPLPLPSLESLGFQYTPYEIGTGQPNANLIDNYHETRDLPFIKGTSRISVHLRFGMISIRAMAQLGLAHNQKWLNELIWRDFYQNIIYHFPHSAHSAFKPDYDHITWEQNDAHFQAWCEGKTGYPIVDAGMRELAATGFMHNRVRMITASFLTKHLLLDWRLGEAWFAQKLMDYDLASNVGGWQWAASSGCDAAPYFRVFNPSLQQDKFDKDRLYIKKWVPEYGTAKYPKPIVDHKFARDRAIARFQEGLADAKNSK